MFEDIKYMTNDYRLKPQWFFSFNFKSLNLTFKINFITSVTNNTISPGFSDFYIQLFNCHFFTVR